MARPFARSTPGTVVMNHRCAWAVGENVYEVISRDGRTRYRVPVVGGVPVCSCPAGVHRRSCWHAAVVLRRLIRERHVGVLALLGNALRRAA